MAGQPQKIRQHQERARVLALSHLFDPDPEKPDEIAPAARALPLPAGLTDRTSAARELLAFLASPFADVRRLAASALGKMAPEQPAASQFVPALVRLAAEDPHPQVRQYAAKAVGRYPTAAVLLVDRLKDVARDATAPGYVRTAAAEAVAAIQTAARAAHAQRHRWCARCRRIIAEDEYFRSMDRWGRPYCYHCFDERALENQDFESTVEAAKRRRTTDGVAVQSRGELIIADYLVREGIRYIYDERYRISGADLVRPDFYLPEFDLYIEYAGMDTPAYNANLQRKHILYQRAGKKLITLTFRDDARLTEVLAAKLSRYMRPQAAAPA